MGFPKILLAVFLFILPFFTPAGKEHKAKNPASTAFNYDSLKSIVNKSGWNNTLIENSRFYLLNRQYKSEEELNNIDSLRGEVEKSILKSVVYRREAKFEDAFDGLNSVLVKQPVYLQYYDDLVSAAAATNQFSLLRSYLEKNSFPEDKKNYLTALINEQEGNSLKALELLLKVRSSDSLNPLIYYNLAKVERSLGNYVKAAEYLKSAKKYASPLVLPELMLSQGSLFYFAGKYNEAEKLYKSGLELAKKKGDAISEAKALIDLGIIEDQKGDIEKAREFFHNGYDAAKQVKNIETKAFALSELGVSYTYTNNLVEAKESYIKSYSLYKSLGTRKRLALLSGNTGRVFMTMFDYKQALKYFEDGLLFAGDNKRAQVLNLTGIGDVYSNLSNYAMALKYYKEAENISAEIKDLPLDAEVILGLGVLNYNLNRYGSALEYYKKAAELSGGEPYLAAGIMHKAGLAYQSMDSIKLAEKYLGNSIKTAAETGDYYTSALAATDLASLYLEQNDINKAVQYSNKAENISSPHQFNYLLSSVYLLKGAIKEKGNNFSGAIAGYINAANSAAAIKAYNLEITANNLIANAYYKSGNSGMAEEYFKRAIALVDKVSASLNPDEEVQISYFSGQKELYDAYINMLLKQSRYEEAFNIIDRSRSRNMIQNLTNLKLQSIVQNDSLLSKLYDYEWIVNSGAYEQDKVDEALTRYKEIKEKIEEKHPGLKRYIESSQFLTVNGIKAKLKKDENIISIYTSGNSTYLFTVAKNKFTTNIVNLSGAQIKKIIASISPYYSSDSGKTYYNQDLFSFNADAANRLSSRLLKNTLASIPKESKIIFVPSTELLTVPFEFLVSKYSQDQSAYSYGDKHFLIYDYNISYSPSASAFIRQRENNFKNNNRFLIAGDPSINSNIPGYAERRGLLEEQGGIPRNIAMLPLKYSGEEVRQISSIINADKVLTGNNATETNFKKDAPYSKVIHLSTHSFLFNKQPVIFFSNFYDAENDGFLEAGEIVQLKLNSDLVVLSSCSSALGVVDESEGILGMTKALFEAGTKSVIASLWEVNDKYTSKLMAMYYQKLSEGYDKSEALREAKIQFIKEDSPNPYFWGAFVLSGDVSKLEIKEKSSLTPYWISLLLILAASLTAVAIVRKKRAAL